MRIILCRRGRSASRKRAITAAARAGLMTASAPVRAVEKRVTKQLSKSDMPDDVPDGHGDLDLRLPLRYVDPHRLLFDLRPEGPDVLVVELVEDVPSNEGGLPDASLPDEADFRFEQIGFGHRGLPRSNATFHPLGLNSSSLVLRIESDGQSSLSLFTGSASRSPNPTVVKVSGFAVAVLGREVAIRPWRLDIRGSQNETRAQATRMRTARTSPGETAACRGGR